MEPICQACGYQRKPTDQAPDWECPACGKAYVKTSHPSPNPLVIYADKPAAEQGNRPHGDPSYRPNPKKTPSDTYVILFGTLLGLFPVIGIPILTDPSSASDIIFHGDAGFIALLSIALITTALVVKRMNARIAPDDRKSPFAFYATFFGLIFAVLFFGFTILVNNENHIETKIQRNGLRANADVVRIYTGSCGKRSCSINVEYAFTPSDETGVASKPIHGYADLGDHPDDPRVIYARTNKQVPIAYEVDHPEVSALNFNNDVFRLDHGEQAHSGMAFFGKLFMGALLLVLAIAGLSVWLRPNKNRMPIDRT